MQLLVIVTFVLVQVSEASLRSKRQGQQGPYSFTYTYSSDSNNGPHFFRSFTSPEGTSFSSDPFQAPRQPHFTDFMRFAGPWAFPPRPFALSDPTAFVATPENDVKGSAASLGPMRRHRNRLQIEEHLFPFSQKRSTDDQ